MVWSLLLEEGRGGFMDASKYRQVMTDLFWHGKEPDLTPEKREPGEKPKPMAPSVKVTKLDELRAFNEAIAAHNKPAE